MRKTLKKGEVEIGKTYFIRHSGAFCKVRVESITHADFSKRTVTRYNCTKLSTGRQITVKSASRFMILDWSEDKKTLDNEPKSE